MKDAAGGIPAPRDQITGLNFALLLIDPAMQIVEANPAAENLIGHSARRLIGRSIDEILDFGSSEITKRLGGDSQLVARGLPLLIGDRSLTVNLTISPLQSHPGWSTMTLSDAGKGERFEETERSRNLRAPVVLAHEIKNPLAAIRGAGQLLSRKLGDDTSLTDLIIDEVDRIAQLIDRMQRLGRAKAEPIEALNPHAAIRRALDTVSAAAANQLNVWEEFDPSLPPVLANEGALVQVLINLLANANDACADQDDGRIIIQTRFVSGLVMNVIRLGRPIKLPIEIRISDNGPGIDADLRDDIFEPFVSSKKNGQGLGLALVQKLVRDMDGRVSHERDELTGLTHFRLHLPMAK